MIGSNIFIVSGMSGSGKSLALNVLEDTGFFCIDNLPISLVPSSINKLFEKNVKKIAISVDARDFESISFFCPTIKELKKTYRNITVIFLTASNKYLLQRYSETRRRHPFSFQTKTFSEDQMAPTLEECVKSERELLFEVQNVSISIDTGGFKPSDLKQCIRKLVTADSSHSLLVLQSFAYKNGVPQDSDLVFDARCLPNPFYHEELRELTGKDKKVMNFLTEKKIVQEFVAEINRYLESWLPQFLNTERSYFTVSVGCTGGRHRSVYCIEALSKLLRKDSTVAIRHRNLLSDQ